MSAQDATTQGARGNRRRSAQERAKLATDQARYGRAPKLPRSANPRSAKPNPKSQKPGARLWRWIKRLLLLTLLLALLGVLGLVGLVAYYGRDLPDVSALRNYSPPETTRVLDREGRVLGEIFSERRTVVPLDRIPRSLILCTLAAEDADFYAHEGLDYPGIARVVLRTITTGGDPKQGASTITQQVVKMLLLTPERTFERKMREMILARRLEQELSKDEILHLYLNHINYGHARYGVQEAARYYFGKNVEDLSLAEASAIAGIPQAPARLSLRTHRERAMARQAFILDQLEAKRAEHWPDLSVAEIEAARHAEIEVLERRDREFAAPELMSYARAALLAQVGEEAFQRGGYVIHTSIDARIQQAAREALRSGLSASDERQRRVGALRLPRRPSRDPEIDALQVGRSYLATVASADDEQAMIRFEVAGHPIDVPLESADRYNTEELSASAFAPVGATVRVSILEASPGDGEPAIGHIERGPEGAVVVIDPRTRDVLALVGAYEEGPGFDRARQARRQPGSTYKSIVYALGIREGMMTPATIAVDAPAVYDQWNPQNYEPWRHDGPVRLSVALARSINVVAVRAIDDLGAPAVVDFSRELGIESALDPSLTLALGASAVTPMEMTNAYATFAAGGHWAAPQLITAIEHDGEPIALPPPPASRDPMTPAQAYVMTRMLQNVTRQGGTAARAAQIGRPVAGKTGTSNNAQDAWFIGYTPEIVAGVWVGFDDNRPLGRREGGGRTALPIWMDVVRQATSDQPVVEFAMPSGVVELAIDPATGLLAYEGQEDAIMEVFVEGTEPTVQALPPDVADATSFVLEQFEDLGAEDPGAQSAVVEGHEPAP